MRTDAFAPEPYLSWKAQSGTFVLDFYNEPDEILGAFQPYYQTAELMDVSDPQLVFELYEKLRTSGIFLWNEVEQFCEAFFSKNKSNAAISNICKPAVERWKHRYTSAIDAYVLAKEMFERTKKTGDVVLITNAENTFKDCEKEKVSWISSRKISAALSAFTSLCRKSSIMTTRTLKS